jgi:hypothetical protein
VSAQYAEIIFTKIPSGRAMFPLREVLLLLWAWSIDAADLLAASAAVP